MTPSTDRMGPAGNVAGIALITFSMFAFAVEDALIKVLAATMSTGQILIIIGIGMSVIFGAMTLRAGDPLWDRRLLSWPVIIRLTGELVGTAGFVTAIALSPITIASAIIQVNPLIVTLGAALFLGEAVGPRRWAAIFIGLIGVMMILRPWTEGFDANSLYAILGVFGLAARDLATRRIPSGVSTMALSTYGSLILLPTGALLLSLSGSLKTPTGVEAGLLLTCILVALLAYYSITAAMRVGEVAVVTPFRYTRLVFALPIGYVFFGEVLDLWALMGAGIVVASGVFVLLREARLR